MNKNIVRKGFNFITNSNYRFSIMAGKGAYNDMPDKEFLEKLFKVNMGYPLNLDNPKTFNEKLQWLKLYDHRPEYTMMVDKYKVREYISEQLGEEYLIPLLGVWDDPDDINFDLLPEQFVLKCNHNSGLGMCICKDKSNLDIKKVKLELRKGLKQDYYLTGREWPYKNVPRKIIAEKYMINNSNQELKSNETLDFNGVPKVALICAEKFPEIGSKEDFFNINWKRTNLKKNTHLNLDKEIEMPQELDKMITFSKELTKSISLSRTDFFEGNNHLYFGDITFSPSNDYEKFKPEELSLELDSWIELSKKVGGGFAIKLNNLYIWIHEEHIIPKQYGLNDYKFMCFNGKVLCSFVCSDRFSKDGLKVTFFDRDWNVLPFERHYPKSKEPIPKPLNYNKMINFAEKLSRGIPFVRVDFYEINNKLYFGELTFFPGSGFEEFTPESADRELGDWLKLPVVMRK